MNTAHNTTTAKATAVFFAGPEAAQDKYGDEYPEWAVYAGDDDAEPVGKCYTVTSYERGLALARNMARDRRLPLEIEASRA